MITAIDVRGSSSSSEFGFAGVPNPPFALVPHAAVGISVTYSPLEPGDTAASVVLRFADQPRQQAISLTGHAFPHPRQSDFFVMPERPKVDVLFVIDDSASMGDKLASVAGNFASYFSSAAPRLLDVHIAVTTTDVTATGASGGFVPVAPGSTPSIITTATPDKEQLFAQAVAVGTSGSDAESLLRPIYLALTDPLLNGHNADFYRDEARLEVVIVSDAADEDPASAPVSFYESFLIGLKGIRRRNDVSVSAIIPLYPQAPTGCTYDSPTAGLDGRVAQLVQRTGGRLDDICSPDWYRILKRVGTVVPESPTHSSLSYPPDLRPGAPAMTVTVDGVPYEQYETAHGITRWYYDPAGQSLVFDALAVPDPGSVIEVTYSVACL